ncbi:MAG: N-acetylglucosamine-6-phosphate deacetylase [Thermomicrobium sp.]|nr:N-acetylglucosamine-6-phosphate deacetylase [Thermomicrobium sp.]
MLVALVGGELVDGGSRQPGTCVVVDGERIRAVGRSPSGARIVLDATGCVILPGFIDLHTHGGGGYALHTREPEELLAYARWVTRTGTTAFLATLVGAPDGFPERQLAAAAEALAIPVHGAQLLGVYLEGPFLNPARRGAHHPSWIRGPDPLLAERLLATARGTLRVVTVAPELPGARAVMERFVRAGVTVALGHTDATYEQASDALRRGARLLTHCFNAMPPLLHRAPGPLGALIERDDAVGELIADGHHVLPPVMRFLIRALGPQRIAVVTDAQPGAGAPLGTTFDFAGRPARVADGLARLDDGTIAGSVLTMDGALRTLIERVGVSLEDAAAMLSTTPARILGLGQRKGRILPGYDADLVLLDRAFQVQATLCRGRLAYANAEWLQRQDPRSRAMLERALEDAMP